MHSAFEHLAWLDLTRRSPWKAVEAAPHIIGGSCRPALIYAAAATPRRRDICLRHLLWDVMTILGGASCDMITLPW